MTNSFGAVAGGDCADLADRRRHRDHEHHAGERDASGRARSAFARRWARAAEDILLQFLVESATMALVGGFFGVMGGMVVAQVVTLVLGIPVDGGVVERARRAW